MTVPIDDPTSAFESREHAGAQAMSAAWPELEKDSTGPTREGKEKPVEHQWSIKTESERYIDTLERRLSTMKAAGAQHRTPRSGRLYDEMLPSNVDAAYHDPSAFGPEDDSLGEAVDGDSTRDGDGDVGSHAAADRYDSGDTAEEELIDDSENACLLHKPILPQEPPSPPASSARNRGEPVTLLSSDTENQQTDAMSSGHARSASTTAHSSATRRRVDDESAEDRCRTPPKDRDSQVNATTDSLNGRAREYSPSPLGQKHATITPNATIHGVPSNIRFSDTVRISGGVRTKQQQDQQQQQQQHHHHGVSAPSTPARRRSSLSSLQGQGSRTSLNESVVSTNPSSTGQNNSGVHIHSPSPRTGYHTSGGSRPSSYISDEGRSRASTPASLYVPLLKPSTSAPSPSRTLYWTFGRGSVNGSTTYKELVRKQQVQYERRNARRRRQRTSIGGQKTWLGWLFRSVGKSDDPEGETDEGEGQGGRRRRSKVRGIAGDEDIEEQAENEQARSDVTVPARKSDMQVLFGEAPRRWFKFGYWRWRIVRSCSCLGRSRGDEDAF